MPRVLTGLERIALSDAAVLGCVKGKRVGLLAHPASVTSTLEHGLPVLQRVCDVRVLFGPEHGFVGHAQDMIGVESNTSEQTIPCFSLYGSNEEALIPKTEWLEGLDAVVVDLQDVGSRYYTFVWTAALVLKKAASLGIPTIVLDRPNPIDGLTLEGAPQDAGYLSFVGLYAVPVRHGMTLAEMLRYVALFEKLDSNALVTVPMLGWQRSMSWANTELPWVLPSPNMPTTETAAVYPGGCVVEGTLLSEGRGTTRPFEIWGAPFVNAEKLVHEVNIPGARLRPLTFQPAFHKYQGQLCHGVQVFVTDATMFRPYAAYLTMIAHVAQHHGAQFQWRTEPYEFVADRPAIDLLTGSAEFRTLVEKQKSLDDYLANQQQRAEQWRATREPALFYPV